MLRRFLIVLAALLWATCAHAQLMMTGAGSSGTVAYTGPGDIVSGATAWYGLRAYNAAYATGGTNKSVNLRRALDNATCDFVIATTGSLGGTASACAQGSGLSLAAFATQDATCTGTIASSTTLTCASASSTPHAGSTLTGTGITQPSYIVSCGTFTGGAGTCTLNAAQTVSVGETITMTYGLYVTEAYDQTENGYDAVQATTTKQPELLPNCGSLVPCMLFSGGQLLESSASLPTIGIAYTFSAVAQRNNAFTTAALVIGSVGANAQMGFGGSANQAREYGGAVATAVANDSVTHAMEGPIYGGSSYFNIDGTETTVNPGTMSASGKVLIGSDTALSSPTNGYIFEAGLYPQLVSRYLLCGNQSSYYSITAGTLCRQTPTIISLTPPINPVLTKGGSYGGWSADALAAPAVIYDGNQYVMTVSMWSIANSEWASAFFTSPDMSTWTYVSGSLTTPSSGNLHGNSGLAWWGGKYWWAYDDNGNTVYIAYSTNLTSWTVTNSSMTEADPSLSINPASGVLELWAINTSSRGVDYFTSPDGTTFTSHGTVLASAGTDFGEPSVFYLNSIRYMSTDLSPSGSTGHRNIIMWADPNINLTWFYQGVELSPGSQAWMSQQVFDGSPIVSGGLVYTFYAGSDNNSPTNATDSSIGLAHQ